MKLPRLVGVVLVLLVVGAGLQLAVFVDTASAAVVTWDSSKMSDCAIDLHDADGGSTVSYGPSAGFTLRFSCYVRKLNGGTPTYLSGNSGNIIGAIVLWDTDGFYPLLVPIVFHGTDTSTFPGSYSITSRVEGTEFDYIAGQTSVSPTPNDTRTGFCVQASAPLDFRHSRSFPCAGHNSYPVAPTWAPANTSTYPTYSGFGGGLEISSTTSTGDTPIPADAPASDIDQGGTLDSVCYISAVSVEDQADPGTAIPLGTSYVWNSATNYDVTVTYTGTVGAFTYRFGDENETDSLHVKEVFPDASPFTFTVHYHHTGAFFSILGARAPDGTACDGADGTLVIGDCPGGSDVAGCASGPGSSDDSLQSCLNEAVGSVSDFDLFDPASWVDAAVSALNPFSYVRASICLFKWAFIPEQGSMVAAGGRLQHAFDSSPAGVASETIGLPVAAVSSFAGAAEAAPCEGDTVEIGPVSVNPADACGDTVSGVADTVRVVLSFALVFGAVFLVIRVFAWAFGWSSPWGSGGSGFYEADEE